MIFTIVGIFIIIFGFNNFKKGFLCFLIFKLFLTTNIALISMPGVPILSLDMFIILYFTFLYLCRERRHHCNVYEFPYKVPLIFVLLSYSFSTLFAYVGFTHALSRYMLTVCQEFVVVWLIWHIVGKDDFSFLTKGFAYSFLFISIYGVLEHFLQSNPLMTYEISLLGDADKAVGEGYGTDGARGYRVQSVFEHPIGGGLNWGVFITWMLIILVKNKATLPFKPLVFSSILLSILCILFTNSRGPILFLFVCLMSFIRLRISKTYLLIGTCILVLGAIMNSIPEYSTMFASFFSEDANAEMAGSSADMRFNQLAAAIAIMSQSPLFGLGFKFQEVFYNAYMDDLLGMESVWFYALTTLGLVGVAAYAFLAFYSIIMIPLKFRSKLLFFVSLAYWVTFSLTSLPGFHLYMYYLVLFYIIKNTKKYQKQIEQ